MEHLFNIRRNRGISSDMDVITILRKLQIEEHDSDDSDEEDQSPILIASRRSNSPVIAGQRQGSVCQRNSSKLCVHVGNTTIHLISGNLAEQRADVIINSTASDLDLRNGAGSRALLSAGGKEIQDMCRAKYPSGISNSEVAVTTGGNLKCKKLYHISIPRWNNNNEEEIKTAMTNCLTLADQYEVKSLVVSPLGFGFLDYPVDIIARMMIGAIVHFASTGQGGKNDRTVSIVCHRSQHPAYKALERDLKQLTVQLHIDMYKDELKTPSYWTVYNQGKTLREWNCQLSPGKCWEQVQVSHEERSAIEQIVTNTWMQQFVGHGRDSKGLDALQYSSMQVVDVERIENPGLAERYCQCRANLFRKVGHLERPFPKLEDIPITKRGNILTNPQNGETFLTREIYQMVNENYLFHGTTPDKVDVIAAQGFDARLTTNAMFGTGIYTAESPTKCDQYSDPKDRRDKTSLKKMILARVLLGEMFVTADVREYKRPPCKSCFEDKCRNPNHNARGQGFFDSVVVDGQWNFREFIVYDSSQCYPEYIITYKRI